MSEDSIARQRQRDAEYLAACRAHGITPEPANYMAPADSADIDDIDHIASAGSATRNGHAYRTRADDPVPLKPLPRSAAAGARFLEVVQPHKSDPATFVRTAGRRLLCLSWLLGRRPESLAELARALGVSRASLSSHVRLLEDATGLHGRGQKGRTTQATFRDNAKRSWKLRRLNKALADAAAA